MLGIRLVAGRVAPLLVDEPLSRLGSLALNALAHDARQGSESHGPAVEIADVEIDNIERMHVAVDEARQHEPSTQWFNFRFGTHPLLRVRRRAHEHDLPALDSQGTGE